jgi:hypothetical protein
MALFFTSGDLHAFGICIFVTMDRGTLVKSTIASGSWQAENVRYTTKLHGK